MSIAEWDCLLKFAPAGVETVLVQRSRERKLFRSTCVRPFALTTMISDCSQEPGDSSDKKASNEASIHDIGHPEPYATMCMDSRERIIGKNDQRGNEEGMFPRSLGAKIKRPVKNGTFVFLKI